MTLIWPWFDLGLCLKAPAPPPKTAADAESEKHLKETFKKISGVDLEVDAYELRDILNTVFMKGDALYTAS